MGCGAASIRRRCREYRCRHGARLDARRLGRSLEGMRSGPGSYPSAKPIGPSDVCGSSVLALGHDESRPTLEGQLGSRTGGDPSAQVDAPTGAEGNAWQQLLDRSRRRRQRRRKGSGEAAESSQAKEGAPEREVQPPAVEHRSPEEGKRLWEACPWPWCEDPACRLEKQPTSLASRRGGRQAAEIVLTTCERQRLEGIARAARSSQRDAQRARVVLLAAQGRTNRAIGAKLDIGAKTAGKWRQRYHAEGPKGLRDAPRSGRPPVYTAEQKAWYFQKVLEEVRDNGMPTSRWSCEDLVDFARRAGMDATPDPATLWRWLDKADIKPHKWRYWLKITDPDFETRMKDVTGIYLEAVALAKAGSLVFCVDEKTGMQALERETQDSPTRPGKPRRHDHRYKRHGSTVLIGAFQVHSGKIWGRFVVSRDGPTFAAFIREVCESVPKAPAIHFVTDQLSTHSTPELCEVVAELSGVKCDPKKLETAKLRKVFLLASGKRIIFHYTPLRASWLDQIEIWFSILSRKLLQLGSFSSLLDLQTKVFEFVEFYNRYLAHPFRWTYTGGVCRT